MKATLEFDLTEEKQEYENMIKGGDYYSALWEIMGMLKVYEEKFDFLNHEPSVKLWEGFVKEFWEEMRDRRIEL